MDWRSGSRQNPTGSAFRGISSRSRGRGRGRGTSLNIRGGHTGTPGSISPVTPAPPLPPSPPSPLPPLAVANPPRSSEFSLPSKPPSGRSSHQTPRRTPSLGHLDTSRALAVPIETSTTPGGRPLVARRAPPNLAGIPTHSLPSPKVDSSVPTAQGTSRPKTPRKRSYNSRTRSSSKASTQQVSSVPSTSSLRESSKETPPHMALNTGASDGQSFDSRTDIDILVERVRAMAMAGSAVDKERDRNGIHVPNDGHIDWAGDEDDTLPDLDDWVRPKQTQHRQVEQAESNKCSGKPSLPAVEEAANLSPPSVDKSIQKTSVLNEPQPEDIIQQAQDGKGVMKQKNARKEVEATPGKTKSRGRHGRKRSSVSEAIVTTLATPTSTGSEIQSGEAMGPTKSHPPLIHPLPPKPQLSAPPVRGFRSRGPVHTNQPVAKTSDSASNETSSAGPREEHSEELSSIKDVKPAMEAKNTTAATSPEPQVRKRAFDPSVDWANAPRSPEKATIETIHEAPEPPSFSVGHSPNPTTRKRAFDPSVDWSKAPSNPYPTPPQDRSRGTFPRHSVSPRSSARTSPQPPLHTRSQINSPERSPNRWQEREGPTHFRAHSSPQTGPGTRHHTSRPIITIDALSRISRTLGVPGATTPPRGPAAGVVVAD